MSWDPESPEYYRDECSEAEARRTALRLLMDSDHFVCMAVDEEENLKILSSSGEFRESAIRAAHRVLEEEDDKPEWLR